MQALSKLSYVLNTQNFFDFDRMDLAMRVLTMLTLW